MANNAPNVWTQMDYVPPRGRCNSKHAVLMTRCPCLRFMLHPLKLSSSYECDGCSHHASFHSMENEEEDEVRRRWELEAKEKEFQKRYEQQAREEQEREQEEREKQIQQRPKKRVRAIEYSNSNTTTDKGQLDDMFSIATSSVRGTTRGRIGVAKRPARPKNSKQKSSVAEVEDEDDTVVELD